MKPRSRFASIVILAYVSLSMAGFTAEVPPWERSVLGKIAELPPTIAVGEGVTFIADFAGAKDENVRLYVINRSQEAVLLPAQDGNIFSKRETPDSKGNWLRCDSHGYSWCGNSYHAVTIPAGQYYSWRQRLHSDNGEMKPVRFRLYNDEWKLGPSLISNEGTARISTAAIEHCRYDAMALTTGPFEDLAAVALGEVKGTGGSDSDPITIATGSLRRFPGDPRLFETLVQVAKAARQSYDPDAKEGKFRPEMRYREALLGFQKMPASSDNGKDRVSEFLNDQSQDVSNPWRALARDTLKRRTR